MNVYILDDEHQPIKIDLQDPLEQDIYYAWMSKDFEKHRRVNRTQVGEYDVSTVFLTLDHGFNAFNTPVLFETMVFYKPKTVIISAVSSDGRDVFQCRYCTWEEAKEGHEEVVKALNKGTLELY